MNRAIVSQVTMIWKLIIWHLCLVMWQLLFVMYCLDNVWDKKRKVGFLTQCFSYFSWSCLHVLQKVWALLSHPSSHLSRTKCRNWLHWMLVLHLYCVYTAILYWKLNVMIAHHNYFGIYIRYIIKYQSNYSFTSTGLHSAFHDSAGLLIIFVYFCLNQIPAAHLSGDVTQRDETLVYSELMKREPGIVLETSVFIKLYFIFYVRKSSCY